jgi:hypothetical protein
MGSTGRTLATQSLLQLVDPILDAPPAPPHHHVRDAEERGL